MAQQTMTLNQMMLAYQQLTADFQANRIDKAGYSAALSAEGLDAEKRGGPALRKALLCGMTEAAGFPDSRRSVQCSRQKRLHPLQQAAAMRPH